MLAIYRVKLYNGKSAYGRLQPEIYKYAKKEEQA